MTLTIESTVDIALRLHGRRLICAEFMHKPRPRDPREQRVFDFALESRLTELSRHDESAVVFLCADTATGESLAHLPGAYPRLPMLAALVNPEPRDSTTPDSYADTPRRCDWDTPEQWQRYSLTDRWARLLAAFEIAREISTPGYLILPAHDAVWGRSLLATLIRFSQRHAQAGLPAAVSPYTPHQHSSVPGADIPRDIIDALNAAFARDSWLRWRIRSGRYQAFWGKMGMIPFALCADLLRRVETIVWEDDLEIDRALREAGYGVRCLWVERPSLYRQALPVFDEAGLRAVFERTLHYSLPIPGETSLLDRPLDRLGRLRRVLNPRFNRAVVLSESIIAACRADIAARLARCGMSWVDWGAYRHVVRVGDPLVQVWKRERHLL